MLEKVLQLFSLSFLASVSGSSFLRLSFRRRRRGRYVAHMALRFRCLRCACVACMLLVGHARACLRWVLFLSVLSFLAVAFLALSALLFSLSSLSLSLLASASGKQDNVIA